MFLVKNSTKPIFFYVLLATVSFIIAIVVSNLETVTKIELSIQDSFFEIRGPLSVDHSPIVLVSVSEDADAEIPEKWPWPMSIHAKLIDNLNRAGAKAIIFDIIFTKKDAFNPSNDTLFTEAIKKYGNVILAGDIAYSEFADGAERQTIFPNKFYLENNINPIGLVSSDPFIDGYIRSYNFGRNYLNESYLTLALQAIKISEQIPDSLVSPLDPTSKSSHFNLGNYQIQKEQLNSFVINFYGPQGSFPTYSYELVIDDSNYTTVMEKEAFEINSFENPATKTGLLYEEVFKDKIIIVGSTIPELRDFHPTPLTTSSNPRPGYEIHAHALQTVLDGSYISRQKGITLLLIMYVLGVFIVVFNWRYGAMQGAIFSLVLLLIYYVIALQSFLISQVFLNVTAVCIVVFLSQLSSFGYEFINEQREKIRIRSMFSSYVSPKLVDQMISSTELPKLGGETRNITAFFSDIVSFSMFSERLQPQKLVALINEYLTAMTDIINDQGGTLDKFVGDSIMAFYGAPIHFQDHASRACITSQLMQKRLVELRKKWKKDKIWPTSVYDLQHRMGINTGEMITGNMGSMRRFNYTIMGDNVNLASRCESGAKTYNVFTMVTESTKKDAEKYGDHCLFRKLDTIIVKGRETPISIYEIVALRSDAEQRLMDCIGLFEQGIEYYNAMNWDKAIHSFKQSERLEAYPQNPSQIFVARCSLLKHSPPSDDWNGVYVMPSK